MSEHPNAPGNDIIEGQFVELTERAMVAASGGQDLDASLAVALSTAEIDQQIATAQKYKRGTQDVIDGIKELATIDTPTATSCRYALPRGKDRATGKANVISGASIRFAEIVAQQFGNCRIAARVITVDRKEMFVEAEGIFHDLQKNVATASRVRRSIRGSNGRVYSEDMILVTGNAAASIAKRNAILGGVPRAIWGKGYQAVEGVIKGDIKTLAARRVDLLTRFRDELKVEPAQLYAILGVKGENDILLDELVSATGFFTALRNNEVTVEDLLQQAGPSPRNERQLSSAFGTAGVKPGEKVDAKTGEVTEEGAAGESSSPSQSAPKTEPSSTSATTSTEKSPPPSDQSATESTTTQPDTASPSTPAAQDQTAPSATTGQDETAAAGAAASEGEQGAGETSADTTAASGAQTEATAGDASATAGAATTASQAGADDFPGDRKDSPKKDAPTWPATSAGHAGPGMLYHLYGDEVGADGRRPAYKDGKGFSRATTKGGYPVYAAHPPEAEAPAKPEADTTAISTGEDRIDPAQEAQAQAEAGTAPTFDPAPFNEFAAKVEAADSWLTILAALTNFRKTEAWQAAEEDMQRRVRLVAYNKTAQLVADGKDPVKHTEDPRFFTLWLLQADRHDVKPAFQKLMGSPAYKTMTQPQKDALAEQVNAALGEV